VRGGITASVVPYGRHVQEVTALTSKKTGVEKIARRALGNVEVTLGLFLLELFLGSTAHAIMLLVLSGVLILARMKFGSEFTLAQVGEVLNEKEETTKGSK
jgi:hypothetical protein